MKNLLFFFSLLIICNYCFANNTDRKILGSRFSSPLGWHLTEDVIKSGENKVLFIVNLKVDEQQAQKLSETLKMVSEPNSENYGNYLEYDELAELRSVSKENKDVVRNWLISEGVDISQIKEYFDSFHVTTDVKIAEKLFQTSFRRYRTLERLRKVRNGKIVPVEVVRQFGKFSIPSTLQNHIEHVFGLSEFLPIRHLRKALNDAFKYTKQAGIPIPKNTADTKYNGEQQMITPEIIREWYGVPETQRGNYIQSIYADFQWFNHDGLQMFCEKFAIPNTNCGVQHQIGWDCFGSLVNGYCTALEGEADLDVQYISSVAPGSTTWFWEVIDSLSDALTESLWILVWAQQVNAQTVPNTDAPLVHSISYGFPELLQCQVAITECEALGYGPEQYIAAVDAEFKSMGARGWTVLVSSGDDGAQGFSQNFPVEPVSNTVNQLIIDNGKITCMFPSGGEAFECTQAVLRTPFSGNATQLGPSCATEWQYYAKNIHNILSPAGCYGTIVNPMMQTEVNETARAFISPSLTSTCSTSKYPSYTKGSCKITPWTYDANNGVSFYPDYPTASPYVLSVGASQMYCNRNDPTSPCNDETYEIVASSSTGSLITGGGGFSGFHPVPDWQKSAVQNYMNNAPKLPPSNTFNSTNRAYPDISFLGHNFLVVTAVNNGTGMELEPVPVDGTSASSPGLAAFVSLWNTALLEAGKPTLGFFNPKLYDLYAKNPSIVNDITQGDISCVRVTLGVCSQWTYYSTKGYDVASGLGTPKFQEILSALLN